MDKAVKILFAILLLGLQPSYCLGSNGAIILKKNIFLPPNERSKKEEQNPNAITQEKFQEHYLLYGVISSGEYGVALIKVNPKKRREVPKELQDKGVLRIRPGQTLDGYTLKTIEADKAIFERSGKRIELSTFDIDKKPERQTKISVAKATPQARPMPVPTHQPSATSGGAKIKSTSSVKKAPSKRPTVSKNAHRFIGPNPVKRPEGTPSATGSKTGVPNPFLRAIQRARQNGGAPQGSGVNPFLQMIKGKK